MSNDLAEALDRGTGTEDCRSCEIVRMATGGDTRAVATYVLETADDEAVIVSGPGIRGLIIVPRNHISGLEELPPARRSHLLAAVRRASRSLGDTAPDSTSRVAVLHDPPGSEDHVCFHVVPDGPAARLGPTRPPSST